MNRFNPASECVRQWGALMLGMAGLYSQAVPKEGQYIASDTNRYSRDQLLSACSSATFLCVPPGDGLRVALDRDMDGYFDAIEIAEGSDPADSDSTPEEDWWWPFFQWFS